MFKIRNNTSIALIFLISCLFFATITVAQEAPDSNNSDIDIFNDPDDDDDTNVVGDVVGDVVEDKVGDKAGDEVGDKADDEVSDIFGDEVGNVVGDIVEDEFGDFVEDEIGSPIRDEFGDFVESQGLGGLNDIFGTSGKIDDEYLENQTGIVPDALNIVDKFFNINIKRGRFKLRNLDKIVASIRGEECPVVFNIVPGICPDATNGLELPKPGEIEDDGEVRGSGKLRRNSQPQQDVLSSNRFVIEGDLANLFDQQSSRAFAFDYLDETGDEWLLSNTLENQALLAGSNLILEDLIQLTADAQELTVTQDVAKNLTGIELLGSQIDVNNGLLLGRMNTSLLTLQQQNASLIQLSANISEGLDESNRITRTKRDIAAVDSFRTTVLIPGLE